MRLITIGTCLGAVLMVMGTVGTTTAMGTRLCGETRETLYVNTCEKVYGYNTVTTNTSGINTTTYFQTKSGGFVASCKGSSMPGNISSPGGEYQQWVILKNSSLTFSECTSRVWALDAGSIAIEYIPESPFPKIYGLGQTLEVTYMGFNCVYYIPTWTHLGSWEQWGNFPKIAIAGQSIWEGNLKLKAGGFICPSTLNWSGSYEVIAPYWVEVIK